VIEEEHRVDKETSTRRTAKGAHVRAFVMRARKPSPMILILFIAPMRSNKGIGEGHKERWTRST